MKRAVSLPEDCGSAAGIKGRLMLDSAPEASPRTQATPRKREWLRDNCAMTTNQRGRRSAGAVVFRRSARGVRLLVLRAYANWDFPKGRVEPGETELDAARREVTEETGLSGCEYPFGDAFIDTLPYAGGKIARYFLAETREERVTLPVSPELGRAEHDESRWVSFDEAEELLPSRLAQVLDWARRTIEGN
jgi:8-oxo-dGTP pyrophosphatase MutT (NUDIX family)